MTNTPEAAAAVLDSQAAILGGPISIDDGPVDLVVDGEHAVAWLSGQIDVSNAADILDHGSLAIADYRIDALVLDVSQVTFLDSTGLGALIDLRNQANAAQKRLALRGVTPPVTRLLTLTGLDESFGLSTDDAGRC